MSTDNPAQLHDRSTRNIALSPQERARLDEWYAQQDQNESALLARAPGSTNQATLRSQFDAAVGQLLTVAHRIQTLTSENDKLRREVAVLQEQLAQKAAAQSA